MFNFVLFVPPVVCSIMDKQTGRLEDRVLKRIFLIIIMYYEVFLYFFPNILVMNFQQESIAFWRKKIQRHLLRGIPL